MSDRLQGKYVQLLPHIFPHINQCNTVIAFPNGKINLGLNITRKRDDGYHAIETVFYPIPLYDVLEVIEQRTPATKEGDILFTTSGLPVEGTNENNLCVKAYRLLKTDFPGLPALQIHLHKAIPMGAGLGGGSADGAFMLKMLNGQFQLGLPSDKLMHYAIQLGSDCPFFILNKPCFATGRGEQLESISIDLSSYSFALINPGIHSNTGHAFSTITPATPSRSIKDIIQQPVSTWKDELKNDFETTLFNMHPEISSIKSELYNAGAVYASMSGSGSSVYAFFEKEKKIQLSFPSHYFVLYK